MEKHNIEDYLQYIGASLPMRGSGWRKMRCPFHDDKHASAAINYDENKFKCHGCTVSGDIYNLIVHKEGGTYREAIKFAESISSASNGAIRKTYSSSRGIPTQSSHIGRRGEKVSSRSSEGRSARARDI